MIAALVGWIMVANLVTYALFARDKARAGSGARRLREATLLRWAMLGGTPAAYAARMLLRHKTVKQPFGRRLHAIAVVQIVGIVAIAALSLAG